MIHIIHGLQAKPKIARASAPIMAPTVTLVVPAAALETVADGAADVTEDAPVLVGEAGTDVEEAPEVEVATEEEAAPELDVPSSNGTNSPPKMPRGSPGAPVKSAVFFLYAARDLSPEGLTTPTMPPTQCAWKGCVQ